MPLNLKKTFPHKIWVFAEGEGDGIESRLPFKIFSTLLQTTCHAYARLWAYIILYGFIRWKILLSIFQANEALGISNIIRKVMLFFPASILTNLHPQLLEQYLQQLAGLTCHFMKASTQKNALDDDCLLYTEAFEHMLEGMLVDSIFIFLDFQTVLHLVLPNNLAANLIIFLKKFHLHTLIKTNALINFWEMCHLHNYMVLHEYLAGVHSTFTLLFYVKQKFKK